MRYWQGRLAEGMTISVPERRVDDAVRALRIQDLELTWRYSIGNPYEEFSFPESVDVAEVLAEQGFAAVARAILQTSLTRPATPTRTGSAASGCSRPPRTTASPATARTIAAATPVLRSFVAALGRQIDGSPSGLLDAERFSSDIPDSVLGLHSQAMAWQGLRAMASVWAETGQRVARRDGAASRGAPRARSAAGRRRAPSGGCPTARSSCRAAARRRAAYDSLTEARSGSYWNLVVPYALASGFFAPGSAEATGVLRYMSLHGSRLLGLVRAGAYALYGRSVVVPDLGDGRGVRRERRALPRRQRPGRPARAQPLRRARRRR